MFQRLVLVVFGQIAIKLAKSRSRPGPLPSMGPVPGPRGSRREFVEGDTETAARSARFVAETQRAAGLVFSGKDSTSCLKGRAV
jgi:hypothetical protein